MNAPGRPAFGAFFNEATRDRFFRKTILDKAPAGAEAVRPSMTIRHNTLSGALVLGIALSTGGTALAQQPEQAGQPRVSVATPPLAVEAAEPAAPAAADPAAVKKHSSYALGFRVGVQFAQQFGRFGITADDLETEEFFKAFMTAFKGGQPEVDESVLQQAMEDLGALLEKREQDQAEANLAAGRSFLEENGRRDGVTTTASGLQYEVLSPGGDEKYKAPADGGEDTGTQFLVHYRGTLIDGTEFDASPEGQVVPMSLQVVDGFKEALTTMPVGAKWKIFLPSELAYGPERRSAEIGPNSVLVFELELVKIQSQDAAPAQMFPVPAQEQ